MNALLEAILTFTNWIWGIPMLILLVGGGCFLAVRLEHAPLSEIAIYSDTHHWKIIHEK